MSLSSILLHDRPHHVRQYFDELGIAGFIITRGDEYLGEYVAPYAERLAWLTGFTGSAGLAILLKDKGCVFSDGRYTVQMAEQAPSDLWDTQHSGQHPPREWLSCNAQELIIGYDPRLVSYNELMSWQTDGVTFLPLAQNPIDLAWEDQPTAPSGNIHHHPLIYTGQSSLEKRHHIAETLRASQQFAMVIADCTSLAWLLNIRGDDIAMTPIAHAYGILYSDGTVDVFADANRFIDAPEDSGIHLLAPTALPERLNALAGKTVRLDPAVTPIWFNVCLENAHAHISHAADLCALPKAVKNSTEQDGNKHAHELDGIALARFLYWLEHHGAGHRETELAAKLEFFRALAPEYKGPSFETISAAGPNGAFPHYRAEIGKDRILENNSVYLVDSGAQYPFGTTDITRTVWIGPDEPSQSLKQAFTAVLKGHIAISRQHFPLGLPGHRLDSFARSALWNIGLDFDHGTGHGIGSYLSVHEGPQSISVAPRPTGLVPGMILSNEPGYYSVGEYGIRIENLLLVKESALRSPRGTFLEFETLTFTPIDQRLIESSLLSPEEVQWVNDYHAQVKQRLLPILEEDLHPWVHTSCAPLSER